MIPTPSPAIQIPAFLRRCFRRVFLSFATVASRADRSPSKEFEASNWLIWVRCKLIAFPWLNTCSVRALISMDWAFVNRVQDRPTLASQIRLSRYRVGMEKFFDCPMAQSVVSDRNRDSLIFFMVFGG